MFGCCTFGCFVKQNKKLLFLPKYVPSLSTARNPIGADEALYGYTNNQTRDIISNVFIDYRILKSVRPNVNFFSRAVRYLPKQALNNIPSLCVYYDLNGCDLQIK